MAAPFPNVFTLLRSAAMDSFPRFPMYLPPPWDQQPVMASPIPHNFPPVVPEIYSPRWLPPFTTIVHPPLRYAAFDGCPHSPNVSSSGDTLPVIAIPPPLPQFPTSVPSSHIYSILWLPLFSIVFPSRVLRPEMAVSISKGEIPIHSFSHYSVSPPDICSSLLSLMIPRQFFHYTPIFAIHPSL